MIGRVTGRLVERDAATVLVDVAGIAYEVEVSSGVLQGLPPAGEQLTLHTHFVVREDAQLLYGFASRNERDLFRAFVKINGVGPKLALALISAVDPHTLGMAVRNGDVSILTKVPGVGKKTAERLMVELKSRLDSLGDSGVVPMTTSVPGVPVGGVEAEAEDALLALGYRPAEAARAVATALAQAGNGEIEVQELVRLALRGFARSAS